MKCSNCGNNIIFSAEEFKNIDLKTLQELKYEIEKSLNDDHIVNNRVTKNQPIVDKIVAKKKTQIEALKNVIELLEK